VVNRFPVEFIHYDRTRIIAQDFLKKHHPSLKIPIPIEKIVDNIFRIDIIPIPGLLRDLSSIGSTTVGFISGDLKSIYVDDYIAENNARMYRFTLAHEIGHSILHKKVYKNLPFDSIDSYIDFIMQFQEDDESFKWYEMQANNFAGLVLVPSDKLELSIQRAVTIFRNEKAKRKADFKDIDQDEIWAYLCNFVADEFAVSSDVIRLRVQFDNLRDRFKAL